MNQTTNLHYIRTCLFIGLCALWSCQSKPPKPEEVVKTYVAALAANDFIEASKISTPRQIAYLEALEAVIGDDPPVADSSWVEIETIVCEPKEDLMYCSTIERDAYETNEKEYWLIQHGTTWFIDRPPEDGLLRRREE